MHHLFTGSREEHPGAVPIVSVHDEIVVECLQDQAEETEAWLKKTMVDGMDTVLNSDGQIRVPVEVEARVAGFWGE
jgi:DNA polymerase I-like protein with 3'-5' exonuclease and polymerase domains